MPLATFLISVGWPILRQALIKLGIGIVSYEGLSSLLDTLFNLAQSSWSSVDPTVMQYMSLAGFPDEMGIIFGALTIRLSTAVSKKFVLK